MTKGANVLVFKSIVICKFKDPITPIQKTLGVLSEPRKLPLTRHFH